MPERERAGWDYERIRAEALAAPRLTSLLPYFESIAAGHSLVPRREVVPEPAFLAAHPDYPAYYATYRRNLGGFNHHGLASVPYAMEECIRVGVALDAYARRRGCTAESPLVFYGTSCADGTHARALAEYAAGRIVTLTDSPHTANGEAFHRLLNHAHSHFHLGPYVDVTPEWLQEHPVPALREGFDVVWENTTFQMYGPQRSEQIAYVKRVLKPGALMICIEKFADEDRAAYARRELIKDDLFKARYFDPDDIVRKRGTILMAMEAMQVTLPALADALHEHFEHAWVVWSSSNFHEVVASDDRDALDAFLGVLPPPYVPAPFAPEGAIVRRLF